MYFIIERVSQDPFDHSEPCPGCQLADVERYNHNNPWILCISSLDALSRFIERHGRVIIYPADEDSHGMQRIVIYDDYVE
jgi:hypothetical protein